LLAEQGDLGEAAQILRARADAGDKDAAVQLAELLEQKGDLEEAARIRCACVDAGDEDFAQHLASLLPGVRDKSLNEELVGSLYVDGDLDGLRALADLGDKDAAWYLADLLADAGDLDGLRALASTGDKDAAVALTRLLADRGDLEGAVQVMHARADAGDGDASLLAELLTKQGRPEEAERLLRFGLNLNPDGSITHT
jgi:thioredoxin-like negative regulator of GroEL